MEGSGGVPVGGTGAGAAGATDGSGGTGGAVLGDVTQRPADAVAPGPWEMVDRLGRGINTGNTLEATTYGAWRSKAQERWFQDYAAAGLDHVRIPVRWGEQTDVAAPYTVDPAWFAVVDEVVRWALEAGLQVVINTHHEHWLLDDYAPRQLQRFHALWRQVAEHYKNYPYSVVFELLNEPYFKLSAEQVNEINSTTLPIIRESNPDRIVMLTGGGKTADQAPQQMQVPDDDHLIAWFHYYVPWNYSRCGIQSVGVGEDGRNQDLDAVYQWSLDNNLPLYVGEWGSAGNKNAKETCVEPLPNEARVAYDTFMAEAFASRRMAAARWDQGDVYEQGTGTWVPGLKEALFAGTWNSVGNASTD